MPINADNETIQDADKPVDIVFVDDSEGETDDEDSEEEADEDIVECVFYNTGSVKLRRHCHFNEAYHVFE